MKCWGTLEGENKEKVFYSQCPQKKEHEHDPKKPNKGDGMSGGTIAIIVIGIVAVIGGLIGWMVWSSKKGKEEADEF